MSRQAPSFGDYRDKTSALRGVLFGMVVSIGFYVLIIGMVVWCS